MNLRLEYAGSLQGIVIMSDRADSRARNTLPEVIERRQHPRICYPMPVRVRAGNLDFRTVVKDLSAGGLCFRSPHRMKMGDELRFLVKFAIEGSRVKTMPRISASGTVSRVRNMEDGSFEFAAEFSEYRFL